MEQEPEEDWGRARERTASGLAEPEVWEPGPGEVEGGDRGAGAAPGPREEGGEGGQQVNPGEEGELRQPGYQAEAPLSLCLCLCLCLSLSLC